MKVTGLHVHPVKSCHRVEVDEATIGEWGLVGDREWQVVDGADGSFVSQRTAPDLARVHPELVADGIVLHADGFDDLHVARPASADVTTSTYGGPVPAGDAGSDAAAWFTSFLGRDVRLVGMAPGYDRREPVLFGEHGLNLGDSAPVLVINRASHLDLVGRASEPFGIERWRPNVIVDATEPWVEDAWRSVRVGAARLDVVMPWPRCAIPQVDQQLGTRHHEPARVLKAHRWCGEIPDQSGIWQLLLTNKPLFGMASALTPIGGVVRVGDDVEVLEAGQPLLSPPSA